MTQKISLFALILGLGLLVSPSADAQYVLNISDGSAAAGGMADVSFTTDNTGVGYSGFGWGVCQGGEGFATIDSVDQGADLLATNDGDGADFFAPTVLPNGYVLGVIVNLVQNILVPPGAGLELVVGHYATSGVGTETLSYCSTLGSPAVVITLTLDGGGVSDETTGDLTLNGGSASGVDVVLFESTLNSAAGVYDIATGSGMNVTTTHGLNETADAGGLATQGFSLGFTQSGPCDLVAADPAGPVAATNDGDGPDFFGSNLAPVGGPGFTVGVVYALLGGSDVTYTLMAQDVIQFEYDPNDGALAGNPGPVSCDLTHSDEVGDPFVVNTIVAGMQSPAPAFIDGSITLTGQMDIPHVKGDCNDDGIVNIADGINIINVYVVGGPAVGDCVNACDANGDEIGPDVSDAVYVFNYRFLNGPPPPAPFPDCGVRPDSDCNSYSSCP